jgi:hypothetical protein
MNYRRLEHDLYWGERLLLLSLQHGAEGFRGKAKGKGFSAYLEAQKIPRRLAYRLINKYLRVIAICDKSNAANRALHREVLPPISREQFEQLETAVNGICDEDRVTNGIEAA